MRCCHVDYVFWKNPSGKKSLISEKSKILQLELMMPRRLEKCFSLGENVSKASGTNNYFFLYFPHLIVA